MDLVKTILVAGTWGYSTDGDGELKWWEPGSNFYEAGVKAGLLFADERVPFYWCGKLDGIWGSNGVWESAGRAMIDYARARRLRAVNVIAHSHGGNLVAYAAKYGLRIRRIVTVATPVRSDAPYDSLARASDRWIHIHSGVLDYMQLFGELRALSIHMFQRRMKLAAENIYQPEADHGGLMSVDLWNKENYWRFLNVA